MITIFHGWIEGVGGGDETMITMSNQSFYDFQKLSFSNFRRDIKQRHRNISKLVMLTRVTRDLKFLNISEEF